MRGEWESVVIDRGLALNKLKAELHKQEMVPVSAVVDFYDAILALGKAGGRVEMLDGLIADLQRAPEGEPTNDGPEPHAEGSFRL